MLSVNQIIGFYKTYLKEKVSGEVHFCHADKRRSFLQVDISILKVL